MAESEWEYAKRLNKKNAVVIGRFVYPKGTIEKLDEIYPAPAKNLNIKVNKDGTISQAKKEKPFRFTN